MESRINYFSFLITDKKSIPYSISLFVLVVFLTFLIQLMHSDAPPIIWLYPVFIILMFITFYSGSYFRYQKYFVYQNKLTDRHIQFKKGECEVEIFQTGFKTKPPKQNFDITINLAPRRITCSYILTDDSFILFCKVFDLGVFQRYTNPIMIKLNNTYDSCLNINKNKVVFFDNTHYEGNTLIVPFEKGINGLNKIRIIDFKEHLTSLP